MEEFKVRKIVFSSSSCVYGTPKYLPVDENHPAGVGITNPYGRTKWFTEEIMKDLCTANQVFRSHVYIFEIYYIDSQKQYRRKQDFTCIILGMGHCTFTLF